MQWWRSPSDSNFCMLGGGIGGGAHVDKGGRTLSGHFASLRGQCIGPYGVHQSNDFNACILEGYCKKCIVNKMDAKECSYLRLFGWGFRGFVGCGFAPNLLFWGVGFVPYVHARMVLELNTNLSILHSLVRTNNTHHATSICLGKFVLWPYIFSFCHLPPTPFSFITHYHCLMIFSLWLSPNVGT